MSQYANKTGAEIVHDYVVVRGDLSEQYARDQLAEVIDQRTARAEAAEAKVARVEALAEEVTERAYFGIALEKMLTIQMTATGRAQVPPHWRESAEFAAIVQVPDLLAALADEETQECPQEAFAADLTGVQGEMDREGQ